MCEFHPQCCQKQICGTCVRLYHGETMLEELPGCFLPFINPSESGSPTLSVSKETKPYKSGTVWSQEFKAVVGSQHRDKKKKLTSLLLECCQAHGRHWPTGGCRNESRTWVSRNCAMTLIFFPGRERPGQPRGGWEATCGVEKKQSEARLPRLPTVVDWLKHSTDQPDNSPKTATGLQEVRHACVSTRFSVISLAAKARQSEQSVNRKTAA